MSVYGFFQPSILGLMSHSYALQTISTNIANVNTGGYKGTETRFGTVLSRTVSNASGSATQSDLGGIAPKDIQLIDRQGFVQASERALDVSINGRGFFVLNTMIDGSGEELFTRDGSFLMATGDDVSATADDGSTITVKEGYLVDKNGYFVQGWEPNADGTFPTSASALTSLRIDPFAFTEIGQATSQANLVLNLPAGDTSGDLRVYNIDVYDSEGTQRTLEMRFTKTSTVNRWDLDFVGETGDLVTTTPSANFAFATTGLQETVFTAANGRVQVQGVGGGAPATGAFSTLSPGDTVVLGGPLNPGTYTVASVGADGSFFEVVEPIVDGTTAVTTTVDGAGILAQPLVFNPTGDLASPNSYTINVQHNGGSTSSFTLDVSQMTQFAGDFSPDSFNRDGFAAADMRSVTFDRTGQVLGNFDNGSFRPIYKLALGVFTNPNGLDSLNGNVFSPSGASGPARVVVAEENGFALFNPNSREISNVDLAEEFSRMIVAQNAYNSSATVFRTMDDMTQVARDLKR